jgi:hypothetical protein
MTASSCSGLSLVTFTAIFCHVRRAHRQSFASQKEPAELAAAWPAERLVAVWNSLRGVKPVKGFKSRAASRIWARRSRSRSSP